MNEWMPREKGVFTRRKCWWSGSDHPGPAQDAVHLVSHLPGFALKLLLKVILTWSGPSTHSYHSPDCALPIAYPYRLTVATPSASCSNHTLPHRLVYKYSLGEVRDEFPSYVLVWLFVMFFLTYTLHSFPLVTVYRIFGNRILLKMIGQHNELIT